MSMTTRLPFRSPSLIGWPSRLVRVMSGADLPFQSSKAVGPSGVLKYDRLKAMTATAQMASTADWMRVSLGFNRFICGPDFSIVGSRGFARQTGFSNREMVYRHAGPTWVCERESERVSADRRDLGSRLSTGKPPESSWPNSWTGAGLEFLTKHGRMLAVVVRCRPGAGLWRPVGRPK